MVYLINALELSIALIVNEQRVRGAMVQWLPSICTSAEYGELNKGRVIGLFHSFPVIVLTWT